MLFGRGKKIQEKEGKTVLILDIESGSVGSALARLGPDGSLKLLGEFRKHMPIRPHRGAESLAAETRELLQEAMVRMSELAARLRNGGNPSMGVVSNISTFMSPPWGKPNLANGTPDFVPHMQEVLLQEASPYFDAPAQFFTHAGAAAQGMRALTPYEDKYLLCLVTHEITELVLVHNGVVAGHATIPHGMNLPLRTLKTHGGLSDAEARSALHLRHPEGPLGSSSEHYAKEFKSAAKELFDAYAPDRVWIVSPAGEYFARALSHRHLSELFPQGGVVRALRPAQIHKHLGSPGGQDLFLVLDALYLRYTQ